jgi:hypothetical protein
VLLHEYGCSLYSPGRVIRAATPGAWPPARLQARLPRWESFYRLSGSAFYASPTRRPGRSDPRLGAVIAATARPRPPSRARQPTCASAGPPLSVSLADRRPAGIRVECGPKRPFNRRTRAGPGTSSAARRGPTRPRRGRRLWENDSDPYDSDPGHPAAAQRTDTPQTRMAPSV